MGDRSSQNQLRIGPRLFFEEPALIRGVILDAWLESPPSWSRWKGIDVERHRSHYQLKLNGGLSGLVCTAPFGEWSVIAGSSGLDAGVDFERHVAALNDTGEGHVRI